MHSDITIYVYIKQTFGTYPYLIRTFKWYKHFGLILQPSENKVYYYNSFKQICTSKYTYMFKWINCVFTLALLFGISKHFWHQVVVRIAKWHLVVKLVSTFQSDYVFIRSMYHLCFDSVIHCRISNKYSKYRLYRNNSTHTPTNTNLATQFRLDMWTPSWPVWSQYLVNCYFSLSFLVQLHSRYICMCSWDRES